LTLIFDAAFSGHHPEYINHLINYIRGEGSQGEYLFVLPVQIFDLIDPGKFGEIKVVTFDFEARHTLIKKQFHRSIWHVNLLHEVVSGNPSVDKLLFLNIDPYQYVINTRHFRSLALEVSGILFHHAYRLGEREGIIANLKKWALKKRKLAQLIWMTSNKSLRSVFVLNDKLTASKMSSSSLLSNVFRYLPDPINRGGSAEAPLPDELKRVDLKTRLLVFGALSYRKNVLRIIEAVASLGEGYQLVISGRAAPEYEKKIRQTINKYPELDSLYYNDYLDAEMIGNLFRSVDVVMIPYVDFFGSSGILNTSMMYKKPVVCSNVGLIPEIVEHYKVGLSVDSNNPLSIAEGVKLVQSMNAVELNAYMESHSPEKFAEILLS